MCKMQWGPPKSVLLVKKYEFFVWNSINELFLKYFIYFSQCRKLDEFTFPNQRNCYLQTTTMQNNLYTTCLCHTLRPVFKI